MSMGKTVRQFQKKYGLHIVEAVNKIRVDLPEDSQNIINLSSMEDLIKIADELGKPVIHQVPGSAEDPHVYQVLDGVLRYQYLLLPKTDKPDIGDNN